MEISQFQVPTTPHYPCEKELLASTDPKLGRSQNGPDISDKDKLSYSCQESTHNSCHPACSLVTIPITGTWFCIAHTNLFHTEVSQKAAVQGTSYQSVMSVALWRNQESHGPLCYNVRGSYWKSWATIFACKLGTADEGEYGGRWNQLLCYPWVSRDVNSLHHMTSITPNKMADNDMSFHQHAVIEFLVKKEIPAAEIHQRLQRVYGSVCMGASSVQRWVKHFKDGNTNNPRSASEQSPSNSLNWMQQGESGSFKTTGVWLWTQ